MFKNLFLLSICLFMGCASTVKTPRSTVSPTQAPITKKNDSSNELSMSYLSEFNSRCEKENGDTWGTSLCVPFIIFNPKTNQAVTTHPDPKGAFVKTGDYWIGTYAGPKIYANTSINWGGKNWSMVLWPLPEEEPVRLELMGHEAWHSVQNKMDLPAKSAVLSHLDSYDGRVLIQLELNALFEAIHSPDKAEQHLSSALTFRTLRFKKYTDAQLAEKTLDFNEGLAAYTGFKFINLSAKKSVKYLGEKISRVKEVPSLTRSVSYYTGPLYGHLLDTYDPEWKTKINVSDGFGDLIKKAFKGSLKIGKSLNDVELLDAYAYKTIKIFEVQRKKKKDKFIADTLSTIEVPDSFKIKFRSGSSMMFNPNQIFPIADKHFIFGVLQMNGSWGKLVIEDGVKLIESDGFMLLSLPKKADDDSLIGGKGWSLKLEPGWKLLLDDDGFHKTEATK